MSNATCRGSFALGTACGKCSRCLTEIEIYKAMTVERDKLNTPSSAYSRIEELEAKLAKAVKFIEFLDENYRHSWGETARLKMRTLHAELTGGKDDG